MTRIADASFRLRDHHQVPTLPATPRLGLNLAKLHKPTLKLGNYIRTELAAPPAAVSRPHPGFKWGMLANDSIGDCVIAMMLHSIEEFHLDAQTEPPAFTDQDAISLYSAITGYNPNDPSSDQGTDETTAMNYWEQPGLRTNGTTHTIAATVAVDASNLDECRIAIDEFVTLQIGIALPNTAKGQTEWTVVGDPDTDPDSAPGSWGGHGIPYREYDGETFTCVTWGAELLLTVPFHQAYAQEAHVVVTDEMLNNQGVGPSGVAWDDLVSDIKKLG